ncbi:MAG TPA: hypothetical protein VMW87_03705 [Spirochaetia bacterium]|nr:hypothetical protein [Spirochaetia bacterium]
MKRAAILLILLSGAFAPLFAQNNADGSVAGAGFAGVDRATLQNVYAHLATPDGRMRVLSTMTGIPEQKLKKADELRQAAAQEQRTDQAEIDIRKAQLTRLLLDPHPNMLDVEKVLREGLDWEYKIRLGEIRRDLTIRDLLGDQDWSRFRVATRLIDRIDRARMQQLSNYGTAGDHGAQQFTPQDRELLLRLRALEQRMNRQGQ